MEQPSHRKVTREEMERIGSLPLGKGHEVRKDMEQMEVGEIIHVLRQHWTWKYKGPNVIVNDMNRKGPMKFKCTLARDDSGWFVERVE